MRRSSLIPGLRVLYNELQQRRDCHLSFWNFSFGPWLVAQALRNVGSFRGGNGVEEGIRKENCFQEPVPKSNSTLNASRRLGRLVRVLSNAKPRLLQMHTPLHDALKYNVPRGCLPLPAATLARYGREPQPSPACASRSLPIVPSARHYRGWGWGCLAQNDPLGLDASHFSETTLS